MEPERILPGRAEGGKVVNNTAKETKVETQFLGKILEC